MLKDSNTMGSIEPPKKCSSTCASRYLEDPRTDGSVVNGSVAHLYVSHEGRKRPIWKGSHNPTERDNNDHHGYNGDMYITFWEKKERLAILGNL